MRKILILILAFVLSFQVNSQKVGLVLSGGGSRGIAHIGMIKAFEDNGIPIDYITGTSIGAIVGGLYSAGYSTSEMMALFKSKEFFLWMNGKVDKEYSSYFRKGEPNAGSLYAKIPIDSCCLRIPSIIPMSIINPRQMNVAFMQLFAPAQAACDNNFNNLMVPFRCVSADVHNKVSYIFKDGDLGDAVRASMTFPFVFKPISIDGNLMYDGGIYNNFPSDVMKTNFHPDFVIGSVVAEKYKRPENDDLIGTINEMIQSKPSYKLQKGQKGVVIYHKLGNMGLLDFNNADSAYAEGYRMGLLYVDSIRAHVKRVVSEKSFKNRRDSFNKKKPKLLFADINIEGLNGDQRHYVRNVINVGDKKHFTLSDFKKGYFELLEEGRITEIIPHALYNKQKKVFDLNLNIKLVDNLILGAGGFSSTTLSNQTYFSLGYSKVSSVSQLYNIEGHFGKVLNSLTLFSKTYFPTRYPFYWFNELCLNKYNYFEGEKIFYNDNRTSYVTQLEKYYRTKIGIPATFNSKLEFGFGFGELTDNYMQLDETSYGSNNQDESNYKMFLGSLRWTGNTLDNRMYSTSGHYFEFLAQGFHVESDNSCLVNTDGERKKTEKDFNYFQLEWKAERYMSLQKHFTLGVKIQALYNDKPLLDNYTSTIIQAPAFTPTTHSVLDFNENYRSNKFVGLGVLPIVKFNNSISLRNEIYGFLPFETYGKNEDNSTYVIKDFFDSMQYIFQSSIVFSVPIFDISLYVNNYSAPSGNWNFGINLGTLLFNKRFVE